MISSFRVVLGGGAALLLALAASDSAKAQTTDSRWQAWLGCWQPESLPTASLNDSTERAPASMVCMVPSTTPSGVEVVSFSNGKVVSRGVIDASGARIPKRVDDCNGWETGTWSKDGKRVMLQSEFTCANNVVRKESGLIAMSPATEWVQIQNLEVEGNSSVYLGRLRHSGIAVEGVEDGALVERPVLDSQGHLVSPIRAGCTGSETATASDDGRRVEVRGSFDCSGLRRVSNATFERNAAGEWVRVDKTLPAFSTQTARMAAAGPVGTEAIVELAENVDSQVLETWLTDRNQRFELSGRDLLKLADAGVSSRAIDILVALDNPNVLALRTTTQSVAVEASGATRSRGGGGVGGAGGAMYAGWAGYYDPWLLPWDPYGFRYRNGYGYYGGYGYNGTSYIGNGPIIVIPRPPERRAPDGYAVPGRGYTRDGARAPSRQDIRPTGSDARVPDRAITTTRTTTGTGGSSGSGAARTAKARGN